MKCLKKIDATDHPMNGVLETKWRCDQWSWRGEFMPLQETERNSDRMLSLPKPKCLQNNTVFSRTIESIDLKESYVYIAVLLGSCIVNLGRTPHWMHRPNVRDGKASLQVVDTDKATSPNNHGIASFQGQSTKDEELLHSKVTESDTKHMAIAVEDESNLQSPLLHNLIPVFRMSWIKMEMPVSLHHGYRTSETLYDQFVRPEQMG
eukprot:Gb_29013 [translate_table: standard]